MNQFTSYDSKNYPKFARGNNMTKNEVEQPRMDQSLNRESKTFELTKSRNNKSLLGKSKYGEPYCAAADLEGFNKTSTKLLKASFKHHDPELCVCQACTCGRHLCKFKNVKPDLSKGSVYTMSYDKKDPIPNNINISSEYDRLNGPHLDLGTNYNKYYDAKKGDPNERPVPEDLLKSGGPCQQLTSYSSGFPGYKGANQYVRPTDNAIRADFPLMSRSTYTNSFVPKSAPKPRTQRIPDNLKNRDLWMGKTTYGNFFQQPNPEDYAKRSKYLEKLAENPNFNHQYETIYKNSFLGPVPSVCPAKIAIETRSKGFYNASKQRFAENSDYKAMNPSFHAISTSKHSYV